MASFSWLILVILADSLKLTDVHMIHSFVNVG